MTQQEINYKILSCKTQIVEIDGEITKCKLNSDRLNVDLQNMQNKQALFDDLYESKHFEISNAKAYEKGRANASAIGFFEEVFSERRRLSVQDKFDSIYGIIKKNIDLYEELIVEKTNQKSILQGKIYYYSNLTPEEEVTI